MLNMPNDDRDASTADRAPRLNMSVAGVATLGGLALAFALGGAAAFLLITEPEPPPRVKDKLITLQDMATVAHPVYTREQFRVLVIGKTRDEVNRVLGNVSHGVELGPPEVWHYGSMSLDPDTGRPDFDAGVVFAGERATDIRFKVWPTPKKP